VFELRAAAIIVRRPTGDPADARLLMATNPTCDYAYSIGGAVEFGETTEEAIAREVCEETGTRLAIGPLAAIEQVMYTEGGRDWHGVAHHYWVDVPDDFKPTGTSTGWEGAVETVRWLSLADLDATTFYPACYRDALLGRWAGVRYFVERDGHVTEQFQ